MTNSPAPDDRAHAQPVTDIHDVQSPDTPNDVDDTEGLLSEDEQHELLRQLRALGYM